MGSSDEPPPAPDPKPQTPSSGEEPGPPREDLMAENIGDAIERAILGRDEHQDRSEAEIAGDDALFLAQSYAVSATDITPGWLVAHEPNVRQYRRLTNLINGSHRTAPALRVTSEAEGCALAARALEALGLDVGTMRSGAKVSARQLQAAAAALGPEINAPDGALRIFGDRHAGRRRKAASCFKVWKSTLAVPLAYIGLRLEQTYSSESARNQKRSPDGIELTYEWDRRKIEPRPLHPGDRNAPPAPRANTAAAAPDTAP